MPRKKVIPEYGTTVRKDMTYYRTRVQDVDGKLIELYARTPEELFKKETEVRKQVEDMIFRREHPTVAEYGEKWLLMRSSKVQGNTLDGYRRAMKNFIFPSLGDLYMSEVTADDIRLAMVSVSKKIYHYIQFGEHAYQKYVLLRRAQQSD